MFKAFLLFLWPDKLADLALAQEQERDQALAAIKKIRQSYARAILTILLLALVAAGLAYLVNQAGGLSANQLSVMRFSCTSLIALAVLAKLSWEIQTWEGKTVAEKVNTYLFKVFYRVGVIGILASILINPQ
jgi:hypothetical protein